jgi:PilZ domain
MTQAEQNRIERRCGQRFEYQLPVLLRVPAAGHSGAGFTQNLSSRGALLWTDFPLREGMMIEMTLVMPSKITLAEDMSVRCRARVLRLESHRKEEKPAIAVRIEHYEFLHHQVPVLQQHTPAQHPHPPLI